MVSYSRYIKTYFSVIALLLVIVGLINFLVDPLWYFQGNRVTGVNLPWNERVTKTNLLLNSYQNYDCLILGTSRSTLFDSSALAQDRCFNYSFSGAKIEEYVNYTEYIKAKGIEPKKLYIEVEPSSFNRRLKPRTYETVTDPMPVYRAYLFSSDVLALSVRTLTEDYSFAREYDQSFRGKLGDIPDYEPAFEIEEEKRDCDPERIEFYRRLRQIFPNASYVGFVAPVSSWRVFNESYSPGLLDCQLAGIHQVAALFDGMYDFAVPSRLTSQTDNTYDGNHYYPRVFERVAKVLEGNPSNLGVDVKSISLEEYQKLYTNRLKSFLERVGEAKLWQG